MRDGSPFKPSGWTRPYLTRSDIFTCFTCRQTIEPFDFIQRPHPRKDGDLRARHHDCEDPKGGRVFALAEADWLAEASRGHKHEVSSYHEHRGRSSKRRG